jgi:diguanylate cyclase (GGDEF)-like protein
MALTHGETGPPRRKAAVRTLERTVRQGRWNSWRAAGLAARLGACALAASLTISTALTLVALRHLAALGLPPAQYSALFRWAWSLDIVVVLATSGVTYALAVWRLLPLLDLAEGARRLAAGEAAVRVDTGRSVDEVRALAASFNHMAERLDESYQELERRHRELNRANEVLEQLSATDGLTGLFNHRHFQNQVMRETRQADRTGAPLCLVLVDVDDFKLLNDRLGHSAGDRVLQEIARAMEGQIRRTDYLARYGGEEFVLLLPQTRIDGGIALAEKVRGAVEALDARIVGPEGRVQVTVSVGIAAYAGSADAMFEAADRALYEAKAAGKNRVVSASESPRGAAQA